VASGIVGFVAKNFVAHFRVISVLNWHRKAVTSKGRAGIQYVFNVRPDLCSRKLVLASLVPCVREPQIQKINNNTSNRPLQTTRTTTTTPPLKPSTHSIPNKTAVVNDETLSAFNPSIVLSGGYSAPPQTPKSHILPSKSTPSFLSSHPPSLQSPSSSPLTLQDPLLSIPINLSETPLSALANPFRSKSPRASAAQGISIPIQVHSFSSSDPPSPI
jgi:hypothetical protein